MSLCAVGDLHGDIDHAQIALGLCGAVDAAGRWSGGNLTVVQTGDVLDRGNASLPLLHKMWKLQEEAVRRLASLMHLPSARATVARASSCACVHPYPGRLLQVVSSSC